MRCKIEIDREAAIAAGNSQYGPVVVDCEISLLSPELLEELATCPEDQGVTDVAGFLDQASAPDERQFWPRLSGPYGDAVTQFLRARIAIRARRAEKKIAEQAEKSRQIAAYLEGAREAPVGDFLHQQGEKWFVRPPLPRPYGISESDTLAALAARIAQAQAIATQRNSQIAIRAELAAQAEAEAATRRAEQIAAWVREHGSENQRGRHALELLPESEVLHEIRNAAYLPLDGFTRYQRIVRDDLEHEGGCCEDADLDCQTADAAELEAEEYDQLVLIRAAAPEGAEVTVREHACTCEQCEAVLSRRSARVALVVGELKFSREYAL